MSFNGGTLLRDDEPIFTTLLGEFLNVPFPGGIHIPTSRAGWLKECGIIGARELNEILLVVE